MIILKNKHNKLIPKQKQINLNLYKVMKKIEVNFRFAKKTGLNSQKEQMKFSKKNQSLTTNSSIKLQNK